MTKKDRFENLLSNPNVFQTIDFSWDETAEKYVSFKTQNLFQFYLHILENDKKCKSFFLKAFCSFILSIGVIFFSIVLAIYFNDNFFVLIQSDQKEIIVLILCLSVISFLCIIKKVFDV